MEAPTLSAWSGRTAFDDSLSVQESNLALELLMVLILGSVLAQPAILFPT